MFIPLIFVLAICESITINKSGVDIADWQFYMISVLIMFALVYAVFRYTGRLYVRSGICRFDGESVLIQIKKKEIRITLKDIIRCECQEITVYGTKILVLLIKYRNSSSTGSVKLYSEDLGRKEKKTVPYGKYMNFSIIYEKSRQNNNILIWRFVMMAQRCIK